MGKMIGNVKRAGALILALAMVLSLVPAAPLPIHAAEPELTPVQIIAGANSSYAIRSDGAVFSWGDEQKNFFAYSDASTRHTPGRFMLSDAAWATQGGSTNFVIKKDHTLWAWGYNTYGQLGKETSDTYPDVPEQVMEDVAYVSAGGNYTMFLKTDGSLWAAGENSHGQLGDDTTNNSGELVHVMDDVKDVQASSWGHVLAIKNDDTLWAWGRNDAGQIGDGTTDDVLSPKQLLVTAGQKVTSIAVTEQTSYAVMENGTLWAWGDNWNGALGDGTRDDCTIPAQVVGVSSVAKITAGNGHALALLENGQLWGWGRNNYGQLGIPTTDDFALTPTLIMSDVAQVQAGENHSLVLKENNSLWAWGYNYNGQIGDGTTTNKSEPVNITLPRPIEDVSELLPALSNSEYTATTVSNQVIEISSEITLSKAITGATYSTWLKSNNVIIINDGGHLILTDQNLNIGRDHRTEDLDAAIIVENGGKITLNKVGYSASGLELMGGPLDVREGGTVDLRGGNLTSSSYSHGSVNEDIRMLLVRGDILVNNADSYLRAYNDDIHIYNTGRIIVNDGRFNLTGESYSSYDYDNADPETGMAPKYYHYFTNEGRIEINDNGEFEISGESSGSTQGDPTQEEHGFINKGTIVLNNSATCDSFAGMDIRYWVQFENEGLIDIKGSRNQHDGGGRYGIMRLYEDVTLYNSGVINIAPQSNDGNLELSESIIAGIGLEGGNNTYYNYETSAYDISKPAVAKIHNLADGVINLNNTAGTIGIGIDQYSGIDNRQIVENDGTIYLNNTGNSAGFFYSDDIINNGVITGTGSIIFHKARCNVSYTGNSPTGGAQILYVMTMVAYGSADEYGYRSRIGNTTMTINGVAKAPTSESWPETMFYLPSGTYDVGITAPGYTNFAGKLTVPANVAAYNTAYADSTYNNYNLTPVATPHKVTVNGSYATTTGAGNYIQSTVVYINSGTRSGYTFNGWTVNAGGITITNANSSNASFIMPNKDVTVTANWKKGTNSAAEENTAAKPSISKQPTSKSVAKNAKYKLAVTAKATSGKLSYQWYQSSKKSSGFKKISGSAAQKASYQAPTSKLGTTWYYCVVTNTIGKAKTSTTSKTVSVTVKRAAATKPSIKKQPKAKNVKKNAKYTLSVTAKASPGKLSYQWYKSSKKSSGFKKISGSAAKKASYKVPTSKKGTTYYYCVITNTDTGATKTTATATSKTVKITVK